MNKFVNSFIETSPGTVLKRELKARGMKQKELAKITGIQPSHMSELIKGHRAINDQIADKLSSALGIPAIQWLRFQSMYEIAQKEAELKSTEEKEAEIALDAYDKVFDMKTLFKRLGQNDYDAKRQFHFCIEELMFSPPAQMQVQYGKFHRSEKTGLDKRMINTWAILARYAVRELAVKGLYDKAQLPKLTKKLSIILNENSNTEQRISDALSNFGIRYAVVEKVEKASIDGYSFICNDGIPAIVVTKRLPKIDNLAFAILHEVGHLALHDGGSQPSLGNDADGYDGDDECEAEANKYATDALIPNSLWKTAPRVPLNPFIIQKEYSRWAEENHLNKWIVLGRIAHETGMYKFKTDESRLIR